MSSREIAKIPDVPPLSKKAIELLTTLCFRENSEFIPQVELIFVFGTAICFPEVGEALKVISSFAPQILLTGGIEKYHDSSLHDLPESLMLYEVVKEFIPQNTKVFFEEQSRNTYENLEFGLKLLDRLPKSICFIAKSFHAGRAYLSLRKFLGGEGVVIYQRSFDPTYPLMKVPITAENWHQHPQYKGRVWGEYLRIMKYGKRGDIDLMEVNDLLLEIEQSLING